MYLQSDNDGRRRRFDAWKSAGRLSAVSISLPSLPMLLYRCSHPCLEYDRLTLRMTCCIGQGRDGFAIGQLDDGRVIVAGGTHYPFGVVESGLRTAEMWVPTTNAWQKMPSMNDGHGTTNDYATSFPQSCN